MSLIFVLLYDSHIETPVKINDLITESKNIKGLSVIDLKGSIEKKERLRNNKNSVVIDKFPIFVISNGNVTIQYEFTRTNLNLIKDKLSKLI